MLRYFCVSQDVNKISGNIFGGLFFTTYAHQLMTYLLLIESITQKIFYFPKYNIFYVLRRFFIHITLS